MSALIAAQAGAGLFQLIQGLASGGQGSASDSTGSASNASGGTAATSGHHHKHGGGGFEKLANAVTSALQSVSSGSGSTDINQTITDALTKIFKNGSLNPTGETDPTTDGTQQTSSNNGDTNSTNGLPDGFVQTLKSFGVTPQQFQNDLSAAVKAAQQGGTFDPSTAFKSFPAGSIVDAIG